MWITLWVSLFYEHFIVKKYMKTTSLLIFAIRLIIIFQYDKGRAFHVEKILFLL